MRSLGWLGLAVASLGCGPMTPPSAPVDAGSCSPFVLGTVDDAGEFVPLVEGQDLTIFMGAQGGFHVFVGAQVMGEKAGTLEWTLRSSTGAVLATRPLDVPNLRLDDTSCGWMRRKDQLVFDRNEDVPGARGKAASVSGKLGSLEQTVSVTLK